MASLFGFTGGINLLGHGVRLHIEANTLYKMFDYCIEYDESLNGIRIQLQLLGIQVFLGIGSNVQDFWFFDSSTYYLRQNNQEDNFNINNFTDEELEQGENYGSNEDKLI